MPQVVHGPNQSGLTDNTPDVALRREHFGHTDNMREVAHTRDDAMPTDDMPQVLPQEGSEKQGKYFHHIYSDFVIFPISASPPALSPQVMSRDSYG